MQWALTYSTRWIFQSTHPSGVRPYARGLCRAPSHFNPRTPVGCDFWRVAEGVNDAISIHAPQWGATSWASSLWRWRDGISIHAPQWGATGDTIMDAIIPTIFQSTHPSGVRPPLCFLQNLTGIFQSTHPSGVRPVDGIANFFGGLFQSTHPSGVRPACSCNRRPTDRFQSTHPSGVRRGALPSGGADRRISIHAPQWGATCFARRRRRTTWRFQSTHPSGVRRPVRRPRFRSRVISIHAPQWGATEVKEEINHMENISIHAPQWGATLSSVVTG